MTALFPANKTQEEIFPFLTYTFFYNHLLN